MEDQRKLHLFISMEFDLLNYSELDTTEDVDLEFVDPLELNYGEPENQLNILTEIEKAEENAELSQLAIERDNMEADIEADIIDEDIRYAANYDAVFYEDPAGNTFEAPVVDDIKIHIESDEEYNARVAAIEGEPEIEAELPTFDQIVFEGLKAADEAKLKATLEVEEVKPTETKVVDDWDDDDFNFDLDDTKKDDHGGEFFL
jgi:hypothetical protein